MRKITFILLLFFVVFFSKAQVRNVNPDKNGEPWIVGGWKTLDASDIEKMNQIPELQIDESKRCRNLPVAIDNSESPFFRPVFNQTHGCCAQASGIAYNFTYEMNRIHNTAANIPENQFPSHYTYNFLNHGSGERGSLIWDGWEIVAANGCPTVKEYGGLAKDADYWMSGYEDYQVGMKNRVIEQLSISVGTPEGLEKLKNWFHNHGDGSETGGIVNFAAGVNISGFNKTDDNIITGWGPKANHAMTFSGYNDTIKYDYNGDGQYTNDIDITGDGIVDMRDWEIGAVIVVNTWGTHWGFGGRAYCMYKLLAEPLSNNGIMSSKVFTLKVRETFAPSAIMKVKMKHSSRNKIKIKAGVSTDVNATTPEHVMSFPIFSYQGGDYAMKALDGSPIEISLDVTKLLNYFESGEKVRFFLEVVEDDEGDDESGKIIDFSVLSSTGTEYFSEMHDVSIVNNGKTHLWTNGSISYSSPVIQTKELEKAVKNKKYSQQLLAYGGTPPYKWDVSVKFEEEDFTGVYPEISDDAERVYPDDNDDGLALQKLEFDFPFYNESYNEIYVSTDGSLIFSDNFSYLRNLEQLAEHKAITVFGADLAYYSQTSDRIYYQGDENSATFIWKASKFEKPMVNIKFATTIYPSGEIEFFYGDEITPGLSWVSGISDGSGVNYTVASNSNTNDPSNSQLKFASDPFPFGMKISKDGDFNGVPKKSGTYNINFVVTDFDGFSKPKIIEFVVKNDSNSIPNIDNERNLKCYPNPFTNTVLIEFDLAQSQEVKLEIYDISGKLITTLVDGQLNGENHKIKFENDKLQEGLYFVKLVTDSGFLTKKIIFVK